MPCLDLQLLAKSHPELVNPQTDLSKIRFADLNYTERFKALLNATRDQGKPLACDPFNELLNGHHTVASVQRVISSM